MIKKRICVFCVLCCLLSLFGCGKRESGVDEILIVGEDGAVTTAADSVSGSSEAEEDNTLAECGGISLSAGLYKLFLYKALSSTAEEYGLDFADLADARVLDDSGAVTGACDRASRFAGTEFERVYLLCELFAENGLDLNDSPKHHNDSMSAKEDYLANISLYTGLGIALEDLVLYYSYENGYSQLFNALYGIGGKQEIPESELEEIMSSRMRRIQYTFIPFYDDNSMTDYSEERKAELRTLSKEYLKRYNSGEAFAEIVKDNYLYLDGYGLFFDIENVDIYYSKYKQEEIAEEIFLCAEKLKENEAAIVNAEYYSSVVLRLPVNGSRDTRWREAAMNEAYYSSYGREFEEMLKERLLTLKVDYNTGLLDSISAEAVVSALIETEKA